MNIDNLIDCNKMFATFDETTIKGERSLESLLQEPFEKHIGSFEIPTSLKGLMDIDTFNAVISWYLKWKITEPMDTQNTCTIKKIFGHHDGSKAIIAINLYKYLRNKGYDPEVIEKFLNQQ